MLSLAPAACWLLCREPARPPRLVEGALRCLATLCATREEHRRQLVDCKVLPQVSACEQHASTRRLPACWGLKAGVQPLLCCEALHFVLLICWLQIVAALSDPSAPVRAAACTCMRSLSRSTKLLRCGAA